MSNKYDIITVLYTYKPESVRCYRKFFLKLYFSKQKKKFSKHYIKFRSLFPAAAIGRRPSVKYRKMYRQPYSICV